MISFLLQIASCFRKFACLTIVYIVCCLILELMSVILDLADIRSSYLVHAPLLLGMTLSTVACLILYEVLFFCCCCFSLLCAFHSLLWCFFFTYADVEVLIICKKIIKNNNNIFGKNTFLKRKYAHLFTSLISFAYSLKTYFYQIFREKVFHHGSHISTT